MGRTILPPSASFHEIALELAHAQRIESLPVPLRAIRRPYESPVEFLPWLAWDNGVTWWDVTWSEQQQRNVIANARWVNQRRGTPGAVSRALSTLDYPAELIEWFEDTPRAVPYSFRVILKTRVSAEDLRLVEDMVMDAKNTRSWFSEITISPGNSEGDIILAGWMRANENVSLMPALELIGVGVNDWMTSDFSPSTSFAGAVYSLVIQGAVGAVTYSVTSGSATVNEAGDVTVTGPGAITVTATDSYGRQAVHSISPELWFVQDGSVGVASNTEPEEWAASLGGRIPDVDEMTSTTSSGRRMGYLYGEWGELSVFGWNFSETGTDPLNKYPSTQINEYNQRTMVYLCGDNARKTGNITPSDLTLYSRCCVIETPEATKNGAGNAK